MNPLASIYRFEEAPQEWQSLSTHGGDEDWIVHIPNQNAYLPMYFDLMVDEAERDGYVQGWGHTDRHVLEGGAILIIFAHA